MPGPRSGGGQVHEDSGDSEETGAGPNGFSLDAISSRELLGPPSPKPTHLRIPQGTPRSGGAGGGAKQGNRQKGKLWGPEDSGAGRG